MAASTKTEGYTLRDPARALPRAPSDNPIMVPFDQIRSAADTATVARALNGRGVRVVTPPTKWQFAAYMFVRLPEIETKSRVIEIAVDVSKGELGVGWFFPETKEWISRQGIKVGSQFVRVIIPAGTKGGHLVFDNWNTTGPSEATIEMVTVLPTRISGEDASA
jgi:hypothetical protein